MKRICLLGPTDKRFISYPLIKVLMYLGKTLIVSDDGVYRRFADDYSTEFNYGNSDFLIIPKVDKSIEDRVNNQEGIYEYVLYITTNEIPSNCTDIVYIHGREKNIASEEVLEVLENLDYKEVLVTMDKVKNVECVKITPNKIMWGYIYNCEDNKEFMELKEGVYSSMLHDFFQNSLGLPKEVIKGLLSRKE